MRPPAQDRWTRVERRAGVSAEPIRRCNAIATLLIAVTCLVLRIEVTVAAANVRPPSLTHQFHWWGTEQGLPHNWVECIAQTRDGYLWIGTRAGILRFDGVRFVSADVALPPDSRPAFAKRLIVDESGTLWAATKRGLIRRSPDRQWSTHAALPYLPSGEISSLCLAPTSTLWIAGEGGVNRLASQTIQRYPADAIPHRFVNSICERRDGTLWIGVFDGLMRLDPSSSNFVRSWTSPPGPNSPEADIVRFVHEDRSGQLWFGTDSILRSLPPRADEPALEFAAGPTEKLRGFYEDRQGALWLITTTRLLRNDDEGFRELTIPAALQDAQPNCLFQDGEGNYWIGTAFAGLCRMQPRSISNYTIRDGLPHNDVWSIAHRRAGGVWIGTTAGLCFYDQDRFTRGEPGSNLDRESIRSVCEDYNGDLWVGLAFRSYYHWDLRSGKARRTFKSNGHPQTQVVYSDSSDRIWMGAKSSLAVWSRAPGPGADSMEPDSPIHRHHHPWIFWPWETARLDSGVIWVFSNGQWESRHGANKGFYQPAQLLRQPFGRWLADFPTNTLTDFDVRDILDDRKGSVWFATAAGGLNRIQNNQFSALTVREGLASNHTRALHLDQNGALWIGTTAGLSRLQNGRLVNFSQTHGLVHPDVLDIVEDDFGHFWLASSRGLQRMPKADLVAIANGTAPRAAAIAISEDDGLPTSQINVGGQPAACKLADGTLWFPTPRGVAVVDPRRIRRNEQPPPVVLETVRIDSASLSSESSAGQSGLPRHFDLEPGRAALLEIEYTANSFQALARVRFRHRLLGFDKDWSEPSPDRVARYTNLRPGRYTFQVMACNNHGVWNEAGASFTLALAPHVWQTRWFQPVCWGAAVLTAGLVVLHLRRIHALRQAHAVVQERARIARDLHDDLGSRINQIGLLTAQIPADRIPPSAATLSSTVTETGRILDELVWVTRPEHDRLDHFVDFFIHNTANYLEAAGIRSRFDVPVLMPAVPLPTSVRKHLFLAGRELVHNIAQHSRATEATLKIRFDNSLLQIDIHDNGRGFDPSAVTDRHGAADGLDNVKRRIESCRGQLSIQSAPGQGTRVTLTVPLGATLQLIL